MTRYLLSLLALAALLFAMPAPGQEPGHLVIPVGPGRGAVPVAIPLPNGGSPESAAFRDVVARDLELSGWFRVVDSAAYLEKPGTGLEAGEFQWEDWDVVGASALAKTALVAGDRLRAEVWVYDVPGRGKLGAKAFSASPGQVRSLAHRVANEIILAVTGQTAPFDTRFAFVGSFTGNKEIWLVDFDGEGLSQVTKNGSINLQPSWSPTGSAVAFTSYVAGNPDLYLWELAKGRIRRLSSRVGLNTGAAWHPGGALLAVTLAPEGDPDVFTIDPLDGRRVARLTKSVGIDASPSWSPDGSRVAFVSDRSGGAQIYVMNADGSDVERVTFSGSHNVDPCWSPDGKRLAFVGRDGAFDVFTVRTDGTALARITQAAGDNEDPSWSPDGQYLAFSSTRTGAAHIWLSTADGVHQVQVTSGGGGYTNPAWSPRLGW